MVVEVKKEMGLCPVGLWVMLVLRGIECGGRVRVW